MIFTGNANPALAAQVASKLGIPLGKAFVSKFSDGETTVEINENVRGKDVFVIQSTCAPTNDNLMEIVLMVDALNALPPVSLISATPVRTVVHVPHVSPSRQGSSPTYSKISVSTVS